MLSFGGRAEEGASAESTQVDHDPAGGSYAVRSRRSMASQISLSIFVPLRRLIS